MPTRPVHDTPAAAQAALENLVREVLQQARKLGASQAEASVSVESGLTLTVRLGEVETLEYQQDRGLGITVYFGKRKGSASSADLSPAAVSETVRAAVSIARHTAEDECAGLADAELMARDLPDLDLDYPWELAPDAAIEIARACEDAARAHDKRIENSEGATVTTHRGRRVYANSHGFVGGYASTAHSLTCSVIGKLGDSMQRDYWYSTARDAAELESPEAVGRKAAERTVARLGARKLGTRQAPVLFTPEVARGILGHFLGAMRGGAQYRESSFLLHAAGEKIFPDFLQLSERPQLRKAMASAAFDNEGVATCDAEIVDRGVATMYLLDSYAARKLKLKSNGHAGGVRNLIVKPGELDYAGLLKHMGSGLVVTELMGQGVNGVTGDYSRGAAGFWVERGEVAYPVEEITIAGNLRDMYRNVIAIGNDVDLRGSLRTGSILIAEMTVAGE
ncbi:MAG: metalloprotease PmbA [Gammaproteobacteria bacterium]|nr:metalloprotease PmbA [Gammaproteobacteria bacterium]